MAERDMKKPRLCPVCSAYIPYEPGYCRQCGTYNKKAEPPKNKVPHFAVLLGALALLAGAFLAVSLLFLSSYNLETVNIVLIVVLFTIPYACLIYVSIPRKPSLSMEHWNQKGLQLPAVCILTGAPATEIHLIRGFRINPYQIRMLQYKVPFSSDGWKQYKKSYPFSLRLFKGGLNVCIRIWILGAYAAIYIWTPVFGFLCGLISFVEMFFNKYQMIVLQDIDFGYNSDIVNVKMKGVHEDFLKAFRRLNAPSMDIPSQVR